MRVLGIDPGIQGGVAVLDTAGGIYAGDIPVVAGEVDVDTLLARVQHHAPDVAIIERAGAMPQQGVSSTFKYGVAYGSLRTICVCLQIPVHLVTPVKWKRHFSLDADKEKARALAIRMWPGTGYFARKLDHGRAEAALIALYGAQVLLRQEAAE